MPANPPLRFVVNARSGRAAKALPLVRAFAERHGASIAITQRAGHGAELAREAIRDGAHVVVAVGGDGTMNEVASVLVGTEVVLGLIPCGSGDGLGRHLKIHGSVERALAILHGGVPRTIDTGVVDGHPFFTAAGLGFEAEIAERFNRLQRRGFARYLSTSATAFRRWDAPEYRIVHDGGTIRMRAFTVAVANSDQYGNDARIAPRASVTDGLLNLTAIPPVRAWSAGPLLARLFSGSVDRARGVVALTGRRFVIERPTPGPIHTDGEVRAAGTTVEFLVRPASLRVMCPAAA
jgi:diacylglycerol kinase family enzyme